MFDAESNPDLPFTLLPYTPPHVGHELDLTIARGSTADTPPAPGMDTAPIIASPDRRGGKRVVAESVGGLAAGASLAAGESGQEGTADSSEGPVEADDAPVAGSDGSGNIPVDPPPEVDSPAPDEIPDPGEVARRVADATGRATFRADVAPEFDAPIREVNFDVAPGVAVDTAVVRVRHRSEETVINHKGEEHPAREAEADAVIGHYDPATGSWKFYPEFVPPAQHAALATVIEANAEMTDTHLAVEAEMQGGGMMEVRHPVTVEARQEIAARLEGAGLIEELPIRRGRRIPLESEQFRADEATTATCTIQLAADYRSRTDGGQDLTDELHVTYRGLRVGSAEDGTLERADFSIKIASRPQGETDWIPDRGMVTSAEWEMLAGIPDILNRYETVDPDFSVRDCAVFRNWS